MSIYYFISFKFIKVIFRYRIMGGWREQTIYSDILWVIILSVKYCTSSFFADMIKEQLIKRKKQWGFIKRIRSTIKDLVPKYFSINPFILYSLQIVINGKVNGKLRSNSFWMAKLFKDKQVIKTQWISIKTDYGCVQALSKYGSFGIKVWISRI